MYTRTWQPHQYEDPIGQAPRKGSVSKDCKGFVKAQPGDILREWLRREGYEFLPKKHQAAVCFVLADPRTIRGWDLNNNRPIRPWHWCDPKWAELLKLRARGLTSEQRAAVLDHSPAPARLSASTVPPQQQHEHHNSGTLSAGISHQETTQPTATTHQLPLKPQAELTHGPPSDAGAGSQSVTVNDAKDAEARSPSVVASDGPPPPQIQQNPSAQADCCSGHATGPHERPGETPTLSPFTSFGDESRASSNAEGMTATGENEAFSSTAYLQEHMVRHIQAWDGSNPKEADIFVSRIERFVSTLPKDFERDTRQGQERRLLFMLAITRDEAYRTLNRLISCFDRNSMSYESVLAAFERAFQSPSAGHSA